MLLNIAQIKSRTHRHKTAAMLPPPFLRDHVLWVTMLLRLFALYLNCRHTVHELICSVSWCEGRFIFDACRSNNGGNSVNVQQLERC